MDNPGNLPWALLPLKHPIHQFATGMKGSDPHCVKTQTLFVASSVGLREFLELCAVRCIGTNKIDPGVTCDSHGFLGRRSRNPHGQKLRHYPQEEEGEAGIASPFSVKTSRFLRV